MTFYEKIVSEMTPEHLANLNVKLVTIDNRRLCYLTSPGQLFPYENLEEAVKFEYQWLTSEIPTQENTPKEATEEVAEETAE